MRSTNERLLNDGDSVPFVTHKVDVKMPRVCGPKLANCCLIMSLWGIIMLALMGVFYKIQAVALTEDVKTVDDKGYNSSATNCFIAAGIYVLTFLLSCYQKYAISRSYPRL